MIDDVINEITGILESQMEGQTSYEYQTKHIRKAIAQYALAACIDSAVRAEAESICMEGEG